MNAETVTVEAVAAIVCEVLGTPGPSELDPGAPLTAVFPELDSLAILELIVDLERRFEISVEDEDVTAETFDSLASLTEFVRAKRG